MPVTRSLMLIRILVGLSLAGIFPLLHAQNSAVSAAPAGSPPTTEQSSWPVPDGVFSFEDERMNAWAAQPKPPVVLTGRILNLPADKRSEVLISCALNRELQGNQVSVACQLQPDDTFRLVLPATFPRQQLWLRIKPFFYGEIILSRDLHLEFDLKLMQRSTATATPGVVFSGADGLLNSEVNRFNARFSKRISAITAGLRKASGQGARNDFPARLKTLGALKHEYDHLLRESVPQEAGWFLQNEINAAYYAAILGAARETGHALPGDPIWNEITRHPSYAVTNSQISFYSALHIYLWVLHLPHQYTFDDLLAVAANAVAGSTPELQDAHHQAVTLSRLRKETGHWDAAALKAAEDKLKEAGLLPPGLFLLHALHEAVPSLPAVKKEISSLPFIPKDVTEARVVIGELQRISTTPWLRDYLNTCNRDAADRSAAVTASLAQARTNGATTSLGQPLAELPSGAKLYRFSDLPALELLTRLMHAFPDKALILDFWGPWCRPCLVDLPFSQKTRLALKDEAAEFIYLGSRTEEGSWKRSIAELQLAGTHILLEPKQCDDLMAFFGVGVFPSYVFIDHTGRYRPGVIGHFRDTSPEKIQALLR